MWVIRVIHATSSQDGGVGRYIFPPHSSKRRTTTNLKTKINQDCQKIEPYRSPTTKELKKKHSSTDRGRNRQLRQRVCAARQHLEDWEVKVLAGSPTFTCRQTGRNNWRARQTTQPWVPVWKKKALKPLAVKTYVGCGGSRNSQSHKRVY